jgi:predicted amidophosphoribosyltransferase
MSENGGTLIRVCLCHKCGARHVWCSGGCYCWNCSKPMDYVLVAQKSGDRFGQSNY